MKITSIVVRIYLHKLILQSTMRVHIDRFDLPLTSAHVVRGFKHNYCC